MRVSYASWRRAVLSIESLNSKGPRLSKASTQLGVNSKISPTYFGFPGSSQRTTPLVKVRCARCALHFNSSTYPIRPDRLPDHQTRVGLF